MKTILAVLTTILLAVSAAEAQTADTYVSQGRAFLAAQDLTNADARFALAVATAPGHTEGNVFRAATRLLTLHTRPAGAALLDRLGFAPTSRDLYHWTAEVPRDVQGLPLAPTNMAAAELTAFLRTNVLPELQAAGSNLAVVTDTAFLLNLSSNETSALAVTLDYGDVTLLRAGVKFAEYFGYTVCSWNLEAQLETARAFLADEAGTPEAFLNLHSNLFTFATTNDLIAARQAFTAAAALYETASEFIRNRPTNVTRLFNLDPAETDAEANFRLTLADLQQSLQGPVALQVDPTYSVNLSNHFSGRTSMRALLPQVAGEKIVAGTLPDATFGGMVSGFTAAEIESLAGQALPFISTLSTPVPQPDGSVEISLHGLKEAIYVIEVSTNLQTWNPQGSVFVQQGVGRYRATVNGNSSQYYRVADRSSEIAFQGIVRDLVTRAPLTNAQVFVQMYAPYYVGANLFTAADGSFFFALPDFGFGFYSHQVYFSAPGYGPRQYYGQDRHFSRQVYLAPNGYVQPNDLFASRSTLTGATNSVLGLSLDASTEQGEPNHAGVPFGGRSLWWTWTAPATGRVVIDTEGSDFDTILAVYTGNSLATLNAVASDDSSSASHPSKVSFSAVAGTTYQIAVGANYGSGGVVQLNLRPVTGF